VEEVNEFLESSNPDELSDIIEVVRALGHTFEKPLVELIDMAKKKRKERGGFDSKIVLIAVEE
jgi:predicted house-cleaning noncanonical NTP pyrophosphatase (MazG superfamily)